MSDDIAVAHKAAEYLRELYTNNPETRAKINDCAAIITHQADALSRLTTPPLPKEIARLITRLENLASVPHSEVAAALRTLELENERLSASEKLLLLKLQAHSNCADEETRLAERIFELEAERDALREAK